MNDEVWLERAGWWRRTMALLVDGICVSVPSALLGALLFAMTGGFLQWSGPGLQWQSCAPATISGTLDPAPPAKSDEAAVCNVYSVGGQIGRVLIVGRTTRDKGTVSNVSRSYLLQASNETNGHDLSWLTFVAFAALLIGGEWRTGTTPGKRLLKIRVVAAQDVESRSVPLKQILIRYGVAVAGVVLPLVVALALILLPVAWGGSPSGLSLVAGVVLIIASSAWQIWNLVRIVRRRPTVYDEMAGVEIVRVPVRSAIEAPAPLP